MQLPQHGIVGLYPFQDAAESARAQILALGMEPGQIRLLQRARNRPGLHGVAAGNGPREGPFEGSAANPAAQATTRGAEPTELAAATRPDFSASPAPGALYLLGRGGGLGALVRAESSTGDISALIEAALAAGQTVLVIHGRSEQEPPHAAAVVQQPTASATTASDRVVRRLALVRR